MVRSYQDVIATEIGNGRVGGRVDGVVHLDIKIHGGEAVERGGGASCELWVKRRGMNKLEEH